MSCNVPKIYEIAILQHSTLVTLHTNLWHLFVPCPLYLKPAVPCWLVLRSSQCGSNACGGIFLFSLLVKSKQFIKFGIVLRWMLLILQSLVVRQMRLTWIPVEKWAIFCFKRDNVNQSETGIAWLNPWMTVTCHPVSKVKILNKNFRTSTHHATLNS